MAGEDKLAAIINPGGYVMAAITDPGSVMAAITYGSGVFFGGVLNYCR